MQELLTYIGDLPGTHYGLVRAVRLEFPRFGLLAKYRVTVAERQRTARAMDGSGLDESELDGGDSSREEVKVKREQKQESSKECAAPRTSSPVYSVASQAASPVYSIASQPASPVYSIASQASSPAYSSPIPWVASSPKPGGQRPMVREPGTEEEKSSAEEVDTSSGVSSSSQGN